MQKSVTFGNWVRKDIQYSQFQNYELTYAHFVRFPTPFSWEIWQPGSSPGNNWNLVKSSGNRFIFLWRDANLIKNSYFTSSSSSKLSLTSLIYSPISNFKSYLHSQNIHITIMHDMITFSIKIFIRIIDSNISKLQHQRNSIEFSENENSQQKFIKTHIQKKSPSYNQMKNQIRFYEQLYLYITICLLTINNLLNFKILVYQIIQVKLMTSCWWRDKISWYFQKWD